MNSGKCCRLRSPAEIKVQTNKNSEICKHRYKLCCINQTGQSKTWEETSIKFKKYVDWANIYEIYWDFRSMGIIALYEQNLLWKLSQWLSMIVLVWFIWTPLSNKCICEIYKGREMHRHYVQTGTLLFICYCWRSKFITKI